MTRSLTRGSADPLVESGMWDRRVSQGRPVNRDSWAAPVLRRDAYFDLSFPPGSDLAGVVQPQTIT